MRRVRAFKVATIRKAQVRPSGWRMYCRAPAQSIGKTRSPPAGNKEAVRQPLCFAPLDITTHYTGGIMPHMKSASASEVTSHYQMGSVLNGAPDLEEAKKQPPSTGMSSVWSSKAPK